MLTLNLGDFVQSIKGRDNGHIYLVYKIENDYLFLVDGKYKTLEKPKKKNIKHIKFTGQNNALLKEKLLKNEKILNSEVRKTIDNLIIL